MVRDGKAVLVEEAAQQVREVPLFLEGKIARVLAVEVKEIGFGVVVVFVEVEGEGIIRRAVAEEAVRVKGKRVCFRAVLGFDRGAEFGGDAFHLWAGALPEDKGIRAVGSFKGEVEFGYAELVHHRGIGKLAAIGGVDVLEAGKERCFVPTGEERCKGL
jgi:hypothetical protein